MQGRPVEVYIGTTDHRWETRTYHIDGDTPDEMIEQEAISLATAMNRHRDDVAFIGVYHIPDWSPEDVDND